MAAAISSGTSRVAACNERTDATRSSSAPSSPPSDEDASFGELIDGPSHLVRAFGHRPKAGRHPLLDQLHQPGRRLRPGPAGRPRPRAAPAPPSDTGTGEAAVVSLDDAARPLLQRRQPTGQRRQRRLQAPDPLAGRACALARFAASSSSSRSRTGATAARTEAVASTRSVGAASDASTPDEPRVQRLEGRPDLGRHVARRRRRRDHPPLQRVQPVEHGPERLHAVLSSSSTPRPPASTGRRRLLRRRHQAILQTGRTVDPGPPRSSSACTTTDRTSSTTACVPDPLSSTAWTNASSKRPSRALNDASPACTASTRPPPPATGVSRRRRDRVLERGRAGPGCRRAPRSPSPSIRCMTSLAPSAPACRARASMASTSAATFGGGGVEAAPGWSVVIARRGYRRVGPPPPRPTSARRRRPPPCGPGPSGSARAGARAPGWPRRPRRLRQRLQTPPRLASSSTLGRSASSARRFLNSS